MVEIGGHKDKPKYGLLENVFYLIKNMWMWDKGLFFFYLLQAPLLVLGPLLGIYMPKVLLDSITEGVGVDRLLINIGIPILGIIIIETILRASYFKTLSGRMKYRFKYIIEQVKKVVDTDFENIDGPQGQNRLMKALMATQSNSSGTEAITFVELISNGLGLVLYGSIIFTIHPLLIAFIILASIINYFLGTYVNRFEHRNKDNLAPIEKKLKYIRTKAGDFKAAKDLRLYNMSTWFKDMYGIFLQKRIGFQKQNIYRKYFANSIDGILAFLRDGIAYGILIYSVLYKDMSIGNFILYFGVVSGFSTWLSGIVVNLNELNRIHLETCDLRDFLEMEDKMNRGVGVDLPKEWELPCDIELRNVYYKYPGAEDYTIKNINLHIKKGEKLALVGVNGAGKTTLVKLICGLYTPTKGEIYINGKKSSKYNRDEYFTLFSVVFQDTYLLPMSIERNIACQLEDDIDQARMDRVIELSGLKDKIEALPKGRKALLLKSIYDEAIDLSGGEMQKLMLARALYKDSPIIILDEPTAALDPIAENEIYQKYNELTQGKTSIFISHRLSSTRFCDRIVFIEDGRIVEEGDHNSLMEKGGKYKEMFDMQSHYYKDEIGGRDHEEE
ncbi:MAG: ABC transporter ATP-binding protein [Tissierellia bacterium]|nr:ABC transporter ATP-binding protein [Tissierellia bacterium]